MKTRRHRWRPFRSLHVRLRKQSLPLSGIISDKRQWHTTVNNLQLLSPQWALIIFTGSPVVRMMDVLMVVKQCSCSVDQPVTLDRAPHAYSSSDTLLDPSMLLCCTTAPLFTVQRTKSLLHTGRTQHGYRTNVFTVKCTCREGDITHTGPLNTAQTSVGALPMSSKDSWILHCSVNSLLHSY